VRKKGIIIAIDGPSASGKSTTAKEVARRIGYTYLDTGAMYRAIALAVLRAGVDPEDREGVAEIAREVRVEIKTVDGEQRTYLDGEDVSEAIRTPEVTKAVSPVSSFPEVRELMVRLQREIGRDGGVVCEGRDIGTVVFPDAELKVYMFASPEVRAERRVRDFKRQGIKVSYDEVLQDIIQRDEYDSTRKHSPLRKPEDALELDTTNLSFEEQVDWVVERVRERTR